MRRTCSSCVICVPRALHIGVDVVSSGRFCSAGEYAVKRADPPLGLGLSSCRSLPLITCVSDLQTHPHRAH